MTPLLRGKLLDVVREAIGFKQGSYSYEQTDRDRIMRYLRDRYLDGSSGGAIANPGDGDLLTFKTSGEGTASTGLSC